MFGSCDRSIVALSLVASGLLGCSGAVVEKAEVEGTVTYNGNPVETGMIRFLPKDGTVGPMAAGAISFGKYKVTAIGGVPIGNHKVEIEAWVERPDLRPADVPMAPMPREAYIPAKYNTSTELEATVVSGSTAPIDFDLEGPERKSNPPTEGESVFEPRG